MTTAFRDRYPGPWEIEESSECVRVVTKGGTVHRSELLRTTSWMIAARIRAKASNISARVFNRACSEREPRHVSQLAQLAFLSLTRTFTCR